jgi:hypothetical protein
MHSMLTVMHKCQGLLDLNSRALPDKHHQGAPNAIECRSFFMKKEYALTVAVPHLHRCAICGIALVDIQALVGP